MTFRELKCVSGDEPIPAGFQRIELTTTVGVNMELAEIDGELVWIHMPDCNCTSCKP